MPRVLPLRTLEGNALTVAYEPGVHLPLPDLQEITIYPPPLWIASPRARIYLAKDIVRFRGYLSKFAPDGFDEDGNPEATITVTVQPEGEGV